MKMCPRPTGLSLRDNLENHLNEGIANDNVEPNDWCTYDKDHKLETHKVATSDRPCKKAANAYRKGYKRKKTW
jgi:hypothetical protein